MTAEGYEQALAKYDRTKVDDAQNIVIAAFMQTDAYKAAVLAVTDVMKTEREKAKTLAAELVRTKVPAPTFATDPDPPRKRPQKANAA